MLGKIGIDKINVSSAILLIFWTIWRLFLQTYTANGEFGVWQITLSEVEQNRGEGINPDHPTLKIYLIPQFLSYKLYIYCALLEEMGYSDCFMFGPL